MKSLVLRLTPLILLYLQINGSVRKLEPVIENARHNQCIQIANFLINVIASNNVTRDDLVNVAISDNSLVMDTNCVIQKLQEADDRIVFYGTTDRRHIHSGIIVDYFIFFEDFSEHSLLSKVSSKLMLKVTTKLVFTTHFTNQLDYRNQQFVKHFRQILDFTNNRPYSNGMIIDIVKGSLTNIKFTRTLKKLMLDEAIYQNFDKASIPEKLSIIYFDNPPFSYRNNNGTMIGVESNVIDEFCRRHNLTYEIINDGKGVRSMPREFDISLYRRLVQGPQHFYDITTINDIGSNQCFLVPKNIPVYSSRFAVPFDKFVNILFLTSVLLTAILWKFICIYRKHKISSFNLVTSMLKCIVGYSLPDSLSCVRWSLKERLFLVPFLFMCFMLMDLFTSFMISSLIVELPIRSVESVQELNDSDLMIYEYYDRGLFETSQKLNNPVLNSIEKPEIRTVPNYFDKNLVYVVNCKFGDAFVKSAANFDNNQEVFSVLRGFFYPVPYASYLIQSNFPLKREFIEMVSTLQESGIMDFWSEHFIRGYFPTHSKDDGNNAMTLSAMQLPFFILVTGLCISAVVFIIELVYHKYVNWKLSKVIDLRKAQQRREKLGRTSKILLCIKGYRSRRKVTTLRRERTVYSVTETVND